MTPGSSSITPRIILHGGAGNITPQTVPPAQLHRYRTALLRVLASSQQLLLQDPEAQALDVAVHAVSQLEDDALFNCGHGAVFTRDGVNELEASVMVSRGRRKRGVACSLLRHVRNPVRLAAEMLRRGELDDGAGAYNHVHLSGAKVEELARDWGLEIVEPAYFWTRERWEQHRRGLEREMVLVGSAQDLDVQSVVGDASWASDEYVPQGTVGAVVLDASGTIAVATSTGGLTNKVPGRIGDTPTLGAGFWADEWYEGSTFQTGTASPSTSMMSKELSLAMNGLVSRYNIDRLQRLTPSSPSHTRHAVALSGTGNGDSFLKLAAARTTAAISQYSRVPLAKAVTQMAGPGGDLQRSAGNRFGVTGEGEGGFIGIELVGTTGKICYDFNCGMFRAFIDEHGQAHFGAFRDT